MKGKRKFTLVMPEGEAARFRAKCAKYGLSQTEVLRQFVRLYAEFDEADFFVMPVIQAIALGRVLKEVSEQIRREEG